MASSAPNDFRDTKLDPDVLSTHFRVQTNWHVITGASCSGKTTLIEQLASEGFKTVPEAGRRYFESELAKGRTINKIRENRTSYTCQVYEMMLKSERELHATDVAFLDRALPDGLAFFRIAGLNPNNILPDCFQNRYASVFILNRLPYQRDGVRIADDTTAAYLDSWMSRDYRALGYHVIRVPVLPPEQRLAFVLERISGNGLK